MFRLITEDTVPGPPLGKRMRRALARRKYKDCCTLFEEEIAGARVLRLGMQYECGMTEEDRLAALETGLAKFAALGVRGVVAPERFGQRELLERLGFALPSPAALYKKLAAKLVHRTLEELGVPRNMAAIALYARNPNREVCNAAEVICREARYLALCSPNKGEELRTELRARFGAAVLDELPRIDGFLRLHVFFDPLSTEGYTRGCMGGVGIALGGVESGARVPAGVIEGAALRPPVRLADALPVGCDRGAMLCALAACGAVKEDEITVGELIAGGRVLDVRRRGLSA